MEREKVVRRAAWVICAAGVLMGGWILLSRGLPLVAPFLLAWGLALAIVPLAEKMSAHTRMPRRLCAAAILTLALLLAGLLLTLAVNRLFVELQRLVEWLGGDGGVRIAAAFGAVRDRLRGLGERLPLFDFLWEDEAVDGVWGRIDEIASDVVAETVSGLSGMIPTWVAGLIRGLPALALFFGAWVIASYYFCLDLRAIHAAMSVLVPSAWRERLPDLKRRAAGTALRWLRAYMLLLGLTFCELLIGFSILRLDYIFLLAAGIAVLDLLPVFGVGTVLIPWAVVLFVSGNYSLGLGILVLYGVVTVVRQVAEPRIVGGSIGLHPLLTLAAMYVGFKLFGLAGMLLSPAAALAIGVLVGGEERA